MKKFFKRFIYKYFKPWFFSSDDPSRIKAPYVISFMFLFLTIISIITHLVIRIWQFTRIVELWESMGTGCLGNIAELAKLDISLVPLITVLVGSAGLFIGLYNWGKKKNVPAVGNIPYEGTGNDDGKFGSGEV